VSQSLILRPAVREHRKLIEDFTLELPLEFAPTPEPEAPCAYVAIVDRFLEKAEPLLVPNPNATLWEFQMSWYAIVELADEVAKDVTAELRKLEEELRATSSRSEKQRIGRAMKPLKNAIHDLSIHAQELWIQRIHQPVADTFAALNPDDNDSDWFMEMLSQDRACEHYGKVPLPELMKLAMQP